MVLFCHVLLCSLSSSLTQPPNKHRGCKKKKVLKLAQSFLFQHMFRFCWTNDFSFLPLSAPSAEEQQLVVSLPGPLVRLWLEGQLQQNILGLNMLNLHPEDYERDKTSHAVSEERGPLRDRMTSIPFWFCRFKVFLFWRYDPVAEIDFRGWSGHSWGRSDSWYNGITRYQKFPADQEFKYKALKV